MAKGEIKLPELSKFLDQIRELLERPEVEALASVGRAMRAGETFDAHMQRIARDIQENARTLIPRISSETRGGFAPTSALTPERHAELQDKPLKPMTLRYAKAQLTKKGERIAHLRKQLADLHAAHKHEIKRARTLDHANLKLRNRVDELERRASERDTSKAPVFDLGDRIVLRIAPHEIELRIDQIWNTADVWSIKCSDMRPQPPAQSTLAFADRHPGT